MEDLNKQQMVLLTLLVSFVTSIATGIITVSLLQEAPVAVTQTINRVVERTIETVTPTTEGEKETVREVQVVSEEDLVLASIEKSTASIVRIKTLGLDGTEIVSGLGVVVADGVVATDPKSFTTPNSSILFSDGKVYGVAGSFTQGGVVFLKVGKPAGEKYTYRVATLGNAESLKLGQTIIAIAGRKSNAVSIGRVSQLQRNAENVLADIVSDIGVSKTQSGSPLLNLSGEVIGIEAPVLDGETSLSYIPSAVIKAGLAAAQAEFSK